ncbi:MAG: hypothetical protein LBO07_04850 [Coriobacteriales bacterium]|jgi:hypothetical protein|nr:hypothetical protein [Coriobacteriales bacterium]
MPKAASHQDFSHVTIGAPAAPSGTPAPEEEEELIFIGVEPAPSASGERGGAAATAVAAATEAAGVVPAVRVAAAATDEVGERGGTVETREVGEPAQTPAAKRAEDPLGPMSLTQKIVIALSVVGVIVLAAFLVQYYFFT